MANGESGEFGSRGYNPRGSKEQVHSSTHTCRLLEKETKESSCACLPLQQLPTQGPAGLLAHLIVVASSHVFGIRRQHATEPRGGDPI